MPLLHVYPDFEPRRHRISVRAGIVIAAALWLAVISSTAAAATSVSPPPLLEKLVSAGKIKLLRSFGTVKPGMTGYVVQQNGKDRVVFGEDGYLFVGQLFSPQGDDLVTRYGDQYLPKPAVAAAVKQLENAGHLIVQGPASAPVLYVFADPNCIFCHRFYRLAEPLVKAGKLQLRWAMVGFLKPSSMKKSVAILAAADPLRALRTNEARFDVGAEEGGIAPASHVNAALKALIKAHAAVMQSVGGNGTPTLLYHTNAKHWAVHVGVPTDAWLKRYGAAKNVNAGAAR